MKKTVFLLAVTACAGVLAFLQLNLQNEAAYAPRSAAQAEPAADASGMEEILLALRGDVETGEMNHEGLLALGERTRQVAAVQSTSRASAQYWNPMGPDNVGGRTRCILAVNEFQLFTGGVSGGLWRSWNKGDNWERVSSFPSAMVASIAMAGNGDLYVGTGTLFDGVSGVGGSGFRGDGIYRSTDMGATWTRLEDTDPGAFQGGDWSATDALVADPNVPSRVWYGGIQGVGYIENGVITENALDGISGTAGVQDIEIAVDGSYMLLSTTNGRVYRSTDFATTETVSGSANSPAIPQGFGRCRVAISPDDVNSAYALLATSGSQFGGVFHSADGGQTWDEIWPSGVDGYDICPTNNQARYDLALGVKKGDPGIAYVGGQAFWRCGPSYQAEQAATMGGGAGNPYYVHADVHEVLFTPGGTMYVATDGGIFRSQDGGETYQACNRGLQITQFYGIAYGPTSEAIGGAQDNGTSLIPGDGTFFNDMDAADVFGGDGFDCALSQATGLQEGVPFMATSQNGVLGRGFYVSGAPFTQGGSFYDECIVDILADDGTIGGFYTCMNLYENFNDENSGMTVPLVNPYDETVEDSTFMMETANLNRPFEYTLEQPLRYWDVLIRPAITSEDGPVENTEYPWLDDQDLNIVYDCDDVEVIEDGDTSLVTICDTTWNYAADTLYDVHEIIDVKDPYTSMTVIGFNGGNGVWMTRNGLNFNTQPRWFFLGNAPAGSGTKAIEFAKGDHPEAGNHIFVAGWDAKLYRFSGLNSVWEHDGNCDVPEGVTRTQIMATGAVVTGVAVDPNDPNHVIATVGGYGTVSGGKVQETFNALDEDPSWSNIWFPSSNDLSKMPVYDAIIDQGDPTGNTIMVGTEHGIWQTVDGGSTWTVENLGMVANADDIAAPVFSMEQQWHMPMQWSEVTNNGAIYAGTHGRGIFRSDTYLGSEELTFDETVDQRNLLVFPNPTQGEDVTVRFGEGWIQPDLTVFDMNGRPVRTLNRQATANGQVRFSVADLAPGLYLVTAVENGHSETARLIVR